MIIEKKTSANWYNPITGEIRTLNGVKFDLAL